MLIQSIELLHSKMMLDPGPITCLLEQYQGRRTHNICHFNNTWPGKKHNALCSTLQGLTSQPVRHHSQVTCGKQVGLLRCSQLTGKCRLMCVEQLTQSTAGLRHRTILQKSHAFMVAFAGSSQCTGCCCTTAAPATAANIRLNVTEKQLHVTSFMSQACPQCKSYPGHCQHQHHLCHTVAHDAHISLYQHKCTVQRQEIKCASC